MRRPTGSKVSVTIRWGAEMLKGLQSGARRRVVALLRPAVDDGGFTLIEVVVAMFLLAIVSTGLIPALIGSLKVSGQNTTIATASQLVSQQLDVARSGPATCSALMNYKIAVLPPVVDARGVSFQPVRSSVTCTSGAPGIARVRVTVTLTGNAHVLASASTYIYITS